MLDFEQRGKPDLPRKKLTLESGSDQQQLTYINLRHKVRELNPRCAKSDLVYSERKVLDFHIYP